MAERRGCIAGEQVWITSTPAHNPQLPSHKVAPAASEDWPPMVWKCTCTFEGKGADCSPVQVDRQSWILKPPIHTSYFVLAPTLQKHKSWHKINPQDMKTGKMPNFSILLVIQIMCLAWSWTGLIASLNLPYPRISPILCKSTAFWLDWRISKSFLKRTPQVLCHWPHGMKEHELQPISKAAMTQGQLPSIFQFRWPLNLCSDIQGLTQPTNVLSGLPLGGRTALKIHWHSHYSRRKEITSSQVSFTEKPKCQKLKNSSIYIPWKRISFSFS